MSHDTDNSRRIFLLRALAAGLFVASPFARADVLGRVPRELPSGKSIYRLTGEVHVNGEAASENTAIHARDTVKTGPDSQAIFVVGKDAFILRENSELHLTGQNFAVDSMRLLSGALLSVFGKSRHRMATPTATIGIRGTGLYVEVHKEMSYICTCYGTTDIAASAEPTNAETITSRHHDAPRYITAEGKILPAPFVNHTDEELMLVETLVGRVPPFALFDDSYGGPKRY